LYAQPGSTAFFINFNINQQYIYSSQPYDSLLTSSMFVQIDTSYRNNKWEVGRPSKQHFTSAYSLPNAIVTDTISSCMPGDTSVFVLKVPKNVWYGLAAVSFVFQLDIDTSDRAFLDISRDTGKNWTNLFGDPEFQLITPHIDLSSSTSGWDTIAWSCLNSSDSNYHVGYLLLRFTFISGRSNAYRDGWMIGNIALNYFHDDVPEVIQNITARLTPNPANQSVIIKYSLTQRTDMAVQLFDALGREVKNITILNALSGQTQINTNDLPEGMYFYSMRTAYGQATGKLLVNH